MGQGEGQTEIPGTLNRLLLPGDDPLPRAVARHLLAIHAERLPDLSGLTVLVPNLRAAQDLARCLAQGAGRVLVPPHITPLKSWAETVAGAPAEPHARRLARLHGVLRQQRWLGDVDRWALAGELLGLADALSSARLGEALGHRLRALGHGCLDQEVALVEAVWRSLNCDGHDPQARYARALERLLEALSARPTPIYGYALGPLTAVEQRFLERAAERAEVTLLDAAEDSPRARLFAAAWQTVTPPLAERAALLARHVPTPPPGITLAPAPHLEAEARSVAAWIAEQLNAGRHALALIALDRETARRLRALLERMAVLLADETGWTLSTTAAAAVIDRWLECVASDFPHAELLDLLKSPFVLGDPAARQDAVLTFELALRRRRVAQGMADMQRLAQQAFGEVPDWLGRLAEARAAFTRQRAPLATWLARLTASLEALGATAPLAADAAGAELIATLETLRRDLADDAEAYSFGEWRRWLNLALESANFSDPSVASPVVLTSLPDARGRLFEAVAVIGADAAHLPPRPAPGLFSQATRARLGLPTAAEDAAAATADLMHLLVQGPVLLSWQRWIDDAPNPASPLVLRLQTLHEAAWGCALPTQAAGMPPALASPLPDACVRPAPTVPAARLPRKYSPTGYQTLLDCPYRFFARNVLGLAELDEADEALDKSDYGTLLHRILHAFHDSDPPHEAGAALGRLREISAAQFAALPAYTALAWRSQWEKIQPAYVDAWLAHAASGWRYASGETEFTARHAVEGLGEICLHGRVDRVDVKGDARYVIDYKTSAAQKLKTKLQAPDEAVQLPFYAWLAEAAAAYLPLNETPIVPLELGGETDIGAIRQRLLQLLGAIAAGGALPAHGVDAVCTHCEARGLCRKGQWHA